MGLDPLLLQGPFPLSEVPWRLVLCSCSGPFPSFKCHGAWPYGPEGPLCADQSAIELDCLVLLGSLSPYLSVTGLGPLLLQDLFPLSRAPWCLGLCSCRASEPRFVSPRVWPAGPGGLPSLHLRATGPGPLLLQGPSALSEAPWRSATWPCRAPEY